MVVAATWPSAVRIASQRYLGIRQRLAYAYKASLIEVETVAGGSPCSLRSHYSRTRRARSMPSRHRRAEAGPFFGTRDLLGLIETEKGHPARGPPFASHAARSLLPRPPHETGERS
jgi:hypothetical protein